MPTVSNTRWISPILALGAMALLSACQSGGTAVSAYNGNAIDLEAVKNTNVAATDAINRLSGDRNGTTRTTARKASKIVAAAVAPTAAESAVGTVQTAALSPLNQDDQPTAYAPLPIPAEGPVLRPAKGSLAALPGVKTLKEKDKPAEEVAVGPVRRVKGNAATRRAAYAPLIKKHAARHGVPLKLAMAVVEVESMYRANARGKAGEVGLMQILPRTARFIGYKGPMKKLFDPDTNIAYGMKYLGKAHKLGGGSTCGTILKYNAGHGAKKMNPISRNYCAKVRQIMARS